jgi:adenylate cyclase
MSFYSELKRRNVVKTAVFYGIASWLILQIADLLFEALDLPSSWVRLVLALLILGLPVALVFSWVYEMTPEGIKKEKDLDRSQSITPETGRKINVLIIALLVLAIGGQVVDQLMGQVSPFVLIGVIVLLVVAAVVLARLVHAPLHAVSAEATANTAAPETIPVGDTRKAIAVLPFVNMSGDAENEYFSDGISEEILNLLVKLPQLRVASRTSSFMFKGKEVSIPTIAEELGVDTVLEGSVRKAGDHVRITAQLIDVTTDSHLWSETYDRELKDVFVIQDDIAHSITDALKMTLNPKERRAIQNVATSNARAYDFYLRGRSYMRTMRRHDFENAIRMFQQAIDLDAKYALAYAGIADAYSLMFRHVLISRQNSEKAKEASEKAIALAPDSSEAHASRGLALRINEEYAEAEREFEKAIELNPNLFEAYYYFGLVRTSQGEFEKAADLYLKAIEINPADYQSPIFLAQAYASLGRGQDEMKARLASIDVIQRYLEMNPDDNRALILGANLLCFVGEQEKGLEFAERALGQDENEPTVLYNAACFYARQGDIDRSLELLARAFELGWGDRAWLETDSDLDSLRADPRYITLIESMH